jgi:hypothetical protein
MLDRSPDMDCTYDDLLLGLEKVQFVGELVLTVKCVPTAAVLRQAAVGVPTGLHEMK